MCALRNAIHYYGTSRGRNDNVAAAAVGRQKKKRLATAGVVGSGGRGVAGVGGRGVRVAARGRGS
jgi:hypothetical protein